MPTMDQYLHYAGIVFGYGTLVAGSLLLLFAVLIVILWCLLQLHNALPAARGVELAMAVRLHGSRYNERVFWKALKERAAKSEFAARHIISVVEQVMPDAGEEEEAA